MNRFSAGETGLNIGCVGAAAILWTLSCVCAHNSDSEETEEVSVSSSECRQGRITNQSAKGILLNLLSSFAEMLAPLTKGKSRASSQHNRRSHEAEACSLSLAETHAAATGTAALPVAVCAMYEAFMESAKTHKDTHTHHRAVSHSGLKSASPLFSVAHTWPATRCIFRCTGSGSALPAHSVDVMASKMSNNSVS